MSCSVGPRAATSNLVLSVDPANKKSLPYQPTTVDHCLSDWYCFVTCTVTYSIVTAGVSIYEKTANGPVMIVAGTTNPQRGTFSATAGRTYYGDGPVFMLVEDQQHSIVPVSMAGTKFIHYCNRNNPGYLFINSPFTDTVVSFFDASATGINGTVTSTLTLAPGSTGIIQLPNLGWSYLSSTNPIIVGATQTAADKTVVPPASAYIYNRYLGANITTIGGTPTTQGTYVVYDTTSPVCNITIADGAGSDCAHGLGYQHLCDRYSWGNALSDYVIVAPYDVTVTTSYWTGSAWTVWDTHVLTGTQTAPGYVARDGTQGPGVAATSIQGLAANMAAGATLWKWEGNNPFYLCINDTADDEYSMLGWMSTRLTRQTEQGRVFDTSKNGVTGTLTNGAAYNAAGGGSILFDGTNDYVAGLATTTNFSSGGSMEMVFQCVDFDIRTQGFMAFNIGGGYLNLYSGAANKMRWEVIGAQRPYTGGFHNNTTLAINTWYHVIGTFDSSGFSTIYINGLADGTSTLLSWPTGTWTSTYNLGTYAGYQSGKTGLARVYARCLTADEVKQNFFAIRGRYGI